MQDSLLVSIVIPTFNSADTIKSCLQSILALGYPESNLQIIIADHGSTDTSLTLASSFPVEMHAFPEARTIGELRNRGAHYARGEIIAFLDSDCIVQPNWISNFIALLSEEGVDATGSEYLPSKESGWIGDSWYSHRRKSDKQSVNVIPSSNFIIKRSVFIEIEGFDETYITGEDSDICLRIVEAGYKIISSDKVQVIHLDEPRTLSQFFKKQIWHGKGMFEILLQHPRFAAAKVPLLSIIYFIGFCTILVFLLAGYYAAIFSLLLILLLVIPFALSISKREYTHLWGRTILYSIYFIARALSLVRYNQFHSAIKMFSKIISER